jgi:hypothetical protein
MVRSSSGLIGRLYDDLVLRCGESLLFRLCDCRWFGNCDCFALCYGGHNGLWVSGGRLDNGSGWLCNEARAGVADISRIITWDVAGQIRLRDGAFGGLRAISLGSSARSWQGR